MMFKSFADLIVYDILKLPAEQHLTESLHFFVYDVPKIYFLLLTVVFVVAII